MLVSRRSVRPVASAISSRVELLPQSSAATVSVTYVLHGQYRQVKFGPNESTDGVIGAHEIVGQVRVEALHSNARTADAALRLDEFEMHRCGATPRRVLIVRTLQVCGINQFLESVHSGAAFKSTHCIVKFRIDQPEQRRHWSAVAQVGLVLNDDRPSIDPTHDDRTPASERATEKCLNGGEIVRRRVAKGQRQNSRVRTKRETNPGDATWRVRFAAPPGANVETDDGDTRGCSPGSPVLDDTTPVPLPGSTWIRL